MTWPITLLAVLIALIFLMQYFVQRRATQAEGQPAPDTTSVDGAARADARRLYYFYASHCGPCRAMAPLVGRVCAAHRNLIKVNVAESRELARGFGITATPSFVLVEDGTIRQVKLGGQSERQLLNLIRGDTK